MKHPDPELAVDVAFRMVYCTIARRITHGSQFEPAREVSDADLVRDWQGQSQTTCSDRIAQPRLQRTDRPDACVR
jgi:hypothetical protein